ncbi:hypothetical protein O4215_20645 [Rhodococcus maanshanensis]|uniref:hypothetical protein n=1 Tax=Rhodococcus maanshanensis TaxID=183556 RepID=UPI0022B4BAA1|nr:hypothetical protein [Rhodococcus maanshanensis]MCZ4557974.1 hypothetical protein [Rhodococcus maanshanensis]
MSQRPGKKKTGPEAVERRERQAEALRLRTTGMTLAKIGEQLGGLAPSTIHAYIADALVEITREPAETLRDLEVARLDAMLRGFYERAINGDEKAAEMVLKIMGRRDKYFALSQRAVLELATDTKSLSAIDEWAKAMLGRSDKVEAAEVTAVHIDDL